MKKMLLIGVAALLVYFVVTAPDSAASTAAGFGNALRAGADSVVTFLTQVTPSGDSSPAQG